ncbi:hypothetical protein VTL71DRAFT_16005 [Oculimacula yallundae]|uniref:Zn(2)-C6 fungal-type domain-containing protein n=1 Tax=Oculimacula yallundae TaxID=86028 RepID=A0ABR4CEG2_9HELO
MNESGDKPKRTRKRGPNVKAGCATCKIRRKKCDLTKPACLRCTMTGRNCGFLSPEASKPCSQNGEVQHMPDSQRTSNGGKRDFKLGYLFVTGGGGSKSLPSLVSLKCPDEIQHFDFFRKVCTESFSMHSNSDIWKGHILQAAHTEPLVLHGVLAIGALARSNTQVSISIEVLQGHEIGAFIHLRSGEAIIKSLPSSRPEILSSLATSGPKYSDKVTTETGDSEDLVSAYTRLSVEEYPFLGLCGSSYIPAPKFPLYFDNITDARSTLNSIIAATYPFYRRHGNADLKTLPLKPLPTKVAIELSDIQTLLQSWHQEMERFIADQGDMDDVTSLGAKAVMMQYLVTFVRTSTYFYKNQLIYDQYIPQFRELMELTAGAVLADHAPYIKSRGKGPCYTLDMAMVQPLYFLDCGCRDSELRRQAICIMKLFGRGGFILGGKSRRSRSGLWLKRKGIVVIHLWVKRGGSMMWLLSLI